MREQLVTARGVGPHACLFVSPEGEILPDGLEALSGYLLDRWCPVYPFWTGWDAERNAATVTLWETVDCNPAWLEDAAYRRACDASHVRARTRRQRTPTGVRAVTVFA